MCTLTLLYREFTTNQKRKILNGAKVEHRVGHRNQGPFEIVAVLTGNINMMPWNAHQPAVWVSLSHVVGRRQAMSSVELEYFCCIRYRNCYLVLNYCSWARFYVLCVNFLTMPVPSGAAGSLENFTPYMDQLQISNPASGHWSELDALLKDTSASTEHCLHPYQAARAHVYVCSITNNQISQETHSFHQWQTVATHTCSTLVCCLLQHFLKTEMSNPHPVVLTFPWALRRSQETHPVHSDVRATTDLHRNFVFLLPLDSWASWNEILNPPCQWARADGSRNTYSKVKKSPQVTRMRTRVR